MRRRRAVLLVFAAAMIVGIGAWFALDYAPVAKSSISGTWLVESSGDTAQLVLDANGTFLFDGMLALPSGEGSWHLSDTFPSAVTLTYCPLPLERGRCPSGSTTFIAVLDASGLGPFQKMLYHFGDADAGVQLQFRKVL